MTYGKNALKGKYQLKNPHKYEGKTNQVVYRSSWELKAMNYFDTNSNVLSWGSEEIVIWYRKPTDNQPHRYFMDFHAKIKMDDGSVKTYLMEIKPDKFTRSPINTSKSGKPTKSFMKEAIQYEINQAKWEAARKVCKEQGWEFLIMTEQDLGISR